MIVTFRRKLRFAVRVLLSCRIRRCEQRAAFPEVGAQFVAIPDPSQSNSKAGSVGVIVGPFTSSVTLCAVRT